MPNTEPVVDSAAVLGALVDDARRSAEVPVGFLAAISRGQQGAELTEMGELADAGAAGFTDDGRPVVSPGLMRRALQYASVAGRTVAVHCEEPTLSRDGQMHEGEVSAQLGFTGYPSVAESLMVGRDLALAAYEERPLHLLHLSARESVDELRAAQAAGIQATGEVTPHHLVLTDEAVRSLDPNLKMNPPLRAESDREALVEALRDGTIAAVATDHAPHAREEKEVPWEAVDLPHGEHDIEHLIDAQRRRGVRLEHLVRDLDVLRGHPPAEDGLGPGTGGALDDRVALGAHEGEVRPDGNAHLHEPSALRGELDVAAGGALAVDPGETVAGGPALFGAHNRSPIGARSDENVRSSAASPASRSFARGWDQDRCTLSRPALRLSSTSASARQRAAASSMAGPSARWTTTSASSTRLGAASRRRKAADWSPSSRPTGPVTTAIDADVAVR